MNKITAEVAYDMIWGPWKYFGMDWMALESEI